MKIKKKHRRKRKQTAAPPPEQNKRIFANFLKKWQSLLDKLQAFVKHLVSIIKVTEHIKSILDWFDKMF